VCTHIHSQSLGIQQQYIITTWCCEGGQHGTRTLPGHNTRLVDIYIRYSCDHAQAKNEWNAVSPHPPVQVLCLQRTQTKHVHHQPTYEFITTIIHTRYTPLSTNSMARGVLTHLGIVWVAMVNHVVVHLEPPIGSGGVQHQPFPVVNFKHCIWCSVPKPSD